MATRDTVKLADLVIPNGQALSNIWTAREVYGDAEVVGVTSETAVDGALTYTVDVTDDVTPSAAGTWSTLQILNGAVLADFQLPTVIGKACRLPLEALAFTGIRIHASGNVTATRTFGASKQYIQN